MRRAPKRALGCCASGERFSARVGDVDEDGLFLMSPSVDLEYSEGIELTLAWGDGRQVRVPARVSAWVRGRGVRAELAPDASGDICELFSQWADNQACDEMTRVLVLEDDLDVRRVVERMVRREGFEAVGTANPEEAIMLAQASGVDGVLMDWCLPNIPGREVLRTLRGALPHLPIAVMSGGLAWDNAHEDLTRMGAELVLAKPIPMDDLSSWLNSL